MPVLWFVIGFVAGICAMFLLLLLGVWDIDGPMGQGKSRSCPPCDGNCDQGRNCPANWPKIECERCGKFIERN